MRLWVSRQKEPILSYVPKKDKKKDLVVNGLRMTVVGGPHVYYINKYFKYIYACMYVYIWYIDSGTRFFLNYLSDNVFFNLLIYTIIKIKSRDKKMKLFIEDLKFHDQPNF